MDDIARFGMESQEYWVATYAGAAASWLVAFFIGWGTFGQAFWRVRGRDSAPFIARSLWLCSTGVIATSFYMYVVSFRWDDLTFRLLAAMLIPIGITLQAWATMYFLYRAAHDALPPRTFHTERTNDSE